MKFVALSKVAKIDSGAGFPLEHQGLTNQKYPFFKVGDMNSPGNEFVMRVCEHSISEDMRKKLNAIAFPANTIIFPKIGGAIGTNKKRLLAKPSCIDNNVMAVVPSEAVDTLYLYYLFLNKNLSDFASSSNPPSIRKTTVETWQIPLPPLLEQKRIAAILAKADRLRRVRRYGLELADTYLQSVFLEMFGDPLLNQKQWDTVRLNSEVKHIESGWSPVCEDASSNGERWAVLKLSAVTTDTFLPTENKVLPLDLKPRLSLEVKRGDVLITRKNTYELVAACAYVHETFPKLMLPDTVFRFRLKPESCLTSLYLWGLFSEPNFRSRVQSLASGSSGSMPNISKEKFMNLSIPLPPLDLQQKFAHIVQKFERLRAQGLEAQRQAEHLFQTLLHRAFTDELSESDRDRVMTHG